MPIKTFLARRGPDPAPRSRLGGRRGRSHLAHPVVIGKPPSWRRRALWTAAGLIVAAGAGFGLYTLGQFSAGYDSFSSRETIGRLEQDNTELRARNEQLAKENDAVGTQLRIEQGARQTLEAQVLRMEEERSRLSEDLALFENLFPTTGKDRTPAIRGFRVESVGTSAAPAAWRYRVLVMRTGQPKDEFSGAFTLQVRYRLNDREVMAGSPDAGNVTSALKFRTYQRIEGRFQAPKGAVLLGATARVEENGAVISESVFRP